MLRQPSKKHKAQSAMEYLMTYGWAILIIAVVLGALFSLGVFSGNTLLGNACIAASGYYCQNPTYLHTSAGILVTLGQNSGTNWVAANFVFVPQGSTSGAGGIPNLLSTTNVVVTGNYPAAVTGSNSMISGQQVTLWLPVNGVTAPITVGTAATGAIWAEYQTGTSAVPGPLQYVQVATINIKAS